MEKKSSVLKWMVPCILILTVIIIVLVFIIAAFKSSKKKIKTISESTLQEVLEISELSTVEYTYNAVTRVYDEDDETLMYSVAYDGIVKAGIDFSQVDLAIDKEKKIIHITVPAVEIIDYVVDEGSLEYIFDQDKYNTATVSQAAYKICKADLENKASQETALLSLARENAISTVSGLVEPWIEQIDNAYTIIVE